MCDSSLEDEEKLRRIDEVRAKYKQVEEIFDKKHQGDVFGVGKKLNIPNNRYITNDDCYAIFFEDNTFTIAYSYVLGVPSGIHRIHQIFLDDLVSGLTLDIYSKASFDSRERPYPIWVTKSAGVIKYDSLLDKKNFYFIRLGDLVSLDNEEDRELRVSSPINVIIMQKIIEVVNIYLKEHPLFVEETFLKKVKKQ